MMLNWIGELSFLNGCERYFFFVTSPVRLNSRIIRRTVVGSRPKQIATSELVKLKASFCQTIRHLKSSLYGLD